LATRIVEIRPDEIRDYQGTYEEYVHSCGDDHLDVDRVVLKARKEKQRDGNKGSPTPGRQKTPSRNGNPERQKKKLQEQHDRLTVRVEAAESRIEEIDAIFCEPNYYENTPAAEVRALEEERNSLQSELAELMAEWDETVEAIGALE
jgi:ATP-binding cassette subfamily F protein 3